MQNMGNVAGKESKELMLKGRRELYIGGVLEVISFDDSTAVVLTDDGELNIEGSEIRLCDLDASGGHVKITGRIDAFFYSAEPTEKKRSLRSRLFG